MAWDSSTVIAFVALLAAAGALLIALAQVVQQYFLTGQLIRICDSVVYSFLPGQGRRKWESAQLRFRVVYELPLIGISRHYWRSIREDIECYSRADRPALELLKPVAGPWRRRAAAVAVRAVRTPRGWQVYTAALKVVRLARWFGKIFTGPEKSWKTPRSGEAAWASFFRTVFLACGEHLVYETSSNDADRCPQDLPTVPLPVSMRDFVLFALATGMECTSVNYDESVLYMNGPTGSISSARHPILGFLIHFEARPGGESGLDVERELTQLGIRRNLPLCWSRRLFNIVTVGSNTYTRRQRLVQRTVDNYAASRKQFVWSSGPQAATYPRSTEPPPRAKEDGIWMLLPPGTESLTGSLFSEQGQSSSHLSPSDQQVDRSDRSATWIPPIVTNPLLPSTSAPAVHSDPHGIEAERWMIAKLRMKRRRGRPRSVEHERQDEAVKAATISPSDNEGQLILRPKSREKESEQFRIEETERAPSVKRSATSVDSKDGSARSEQRRSTRSRSSTYRDHQDDGQNMDSDVKTFWFSQMNIMPGYWATPWGVSNETIRSKHIRLIVGAILVGFEALIGLIPPEGIEFVRDTSEWDSGILDHLEKGRQSWPAYARDAKCTTDRSDRPRGVVASGVYSSVKIEAFGAPIPVLRLYGDYSWQVQRDRSKELWQLRASLHELIALDSWLSLVGRYLEISKGDGQLLRHTPSVICSLPRAVQDAFVRSAPSGGEDDSEAVQDAADILTESLADNHYSDAEMAYVLVALLRTMKVAYCVVVGTATQEVEEFLTADMRAALI